MEFPPEHYFQTATQRMRQAQHLYAEGASFALAVYVGGLAVECLLRAFKGRRDPTFDERHDLLRLFAASGILRVDRDALRAKQWSEQQIDEHLQTLRVAVRNFPAMGEQLQIRFRRTPPVALEKDYFLQENQR
jgi:hypothetical protein